MSDFFTLPDTQEVRESDFVRSQSWYEARERCRACSRLYIERFEALEKACKEWRGKFSKKEFWRRYYAWPKAPCCQKHQESLAAFLRRTK